MTTYNVYLSGPNKVRPKTLTDRVIRFLTVGLHKQEFPSKNRYRKFTGSSDESFYWVGKAGAVRAGKSPSNSISLTDRIRANMNLWEKKEGLPV